MTGESDFGQVAAELLHDLAAEIDALRGQTQIVVHAARQHHIVPSDVEAVSAQVERLGAMVRDLVGWVARRRSDLRFDPALEGWCAVEWITRFGECVDVETELRLREGMLVAGPGTFFSRIVTNLVRNALRHARSRVRVTLVPAAEGGRAGVLLTVEDDGPGLEACAGDASAAPSGPGHRLGLGLGLRSTRWLAEQLGASALRYERSGLGGAAFLLWVPAEICPDGGRAAGGRGASQRLRIAVLDDDPQVRRVMRRMLEAGGQTGIAIEAGRERYVRLLSGELEVDALLIDRNLGSLDGIAVWHELRERRPELADRSALLTGALAVPDAPAELVVLQKPLSRELLLDWLAGVGTMPPEG